MIEPVDTIPENAATVAQLLPENKPIKTRKKRAPKHDFGDGMGRVFAHRHDNGNGWVADTAKVADQVYIGPRCEVYNYALVDGKVTLKGESKIFGHAVVCGDTRSAEGVRMTVNAMVYGRAMVRDEAMLTDNCRVHGTACVSGTSRLFNVAQVYDAAQIVSTTLLNQSHARGLSLLIRSNLHGSVITERNCVVIGSTLQGLVHINDCGQVINSTITNNYRETRVVVMDNAVVMDGSRVLSPIVFKRHAACIRSTVGIAQETDSPRVYEVGGNIVFSALSIYNSAQFDAYMQQVADNRNSSGMPSNPNPVLPAATNAANRANYLNLSRNNRRIMTLQETPA